ncbi:hypothetical protein MKW94_012601, partial [Papaver nudicaule]|nr:hypothetical protein [Papaver nudicaule]
MALRATGRLLSQRLSRNFSAQAAESPKNYCETLLSERRDKVFFDEIRSLRDMAQQDTAYWEARPPREASHLNAFNLFTLTGILMLGRLIYLGKT